MIADRAWMQYSPCMKRRSVLLHAVMLAALFLPAFSGWAQHVVVLSIDGLLPDFYLSATNRNLCRNLAALRDRGSSARSMIAVYPSVTYASHASLATGTTPARHGVTANNVFDPVTVNGRGFKNAGGAPTVTFSNSGIAVNSVSYVSPTQLNVSVTRLPGFVPGSTTDIAVTNQAASGGYAGRRFNVTAVPVTVSAFSLD